MEMENDDRKARIMEGDGGIKVWNLEGIK